MPASTLLRFQTAPSWLLAVSLAVRPHSIVQPVQCAGQQSWVRRRAGLSQNSCNGMGVLALSQVMQAVTPLRCFVVTSAPALLHYALPSPAPGGCPFDLCSAAFRSAGSLAGIRFPSELTPSCAASASAMFGGRHAALAQRSRRPVLQLAQQRMAAIRGHR